MHPFAFLPMKFKTESSTHKLLICSTAVAQKVASMSGNQQRLAQNSSCCICEMRLQENAFQDSIHMKWLRISLQPLQMFQVLGNSGIIRSLEKCFRHWGNLLWIKLFKLPVRFLCQGKPRDGEWRSPLEMEKSFVCYLCIVVEYGQIGACRQGHSSCE